MAIKLSVAGSSDSYASFIAVGQDKADYGATLFSTYTPPTPAAAVEIRVAQSTNGTAPGKRLYVYGNGAWSYVALT